jgi:ferrochelatase
MAEWVGRATTTHSITLGFAEHLPGFVILSSFVIRHSSFNPAAMSQGVLLINLGSPDSPSVGDVRRYLRQFLMDERVMDLPYLSRFLLVNGAILPFRPKQSAEAYHKIWWREGSPLVVISQRVCAELQRRVSVPVELAMRYQNPSIESALASLSRQEVDDLLLIPLFPHYAMSSFETAVEEVKRLQGRFGIRKLRVSPAFYDEPNYIEALVGNAKPYLDKGYDHLLFSFHGLPERHLRKSDKTGCHCLKTPDCCNVPSPAHDTCYRAQSFKTVAAFVKATGVTNYSVAFQSRLGRDPWLQPYTDHVLVRLPEQGVKKLLVMCPAFVSDCLETLEEIGMRGQESFVQAGGKELTLIPCLNEHPLWLTALEQFIAKEFPAALNKTKPTSHERDPKPSLDSEARLV